jgi:hypothetical protein
MVETRLMWFGHVDRRPADFVVRRVDQMDGRLVVNSLELKEDLENL